MRRSGETTRTVDAAIQSLFNDGKIIIPLRILKDEDLRGWKKEDKDKVIYDPDALRYSANKVQEYLLHRILQRLTFEHEGLDYNSFMKGGSAIIKLL